MSLDILFLGSSRGTSRHRADTLRRLGHRVQVIDLWMFLPQQPFLKKVLRKLAYEFGPGWMEPYVRWRLLTVLGSRTFDVMWSDQCELVGKCTACRLRNCVDYMVSYTNDDPFGLRDKKRFSLYRGSLEHFDLITVIRQQNVTEAYMHGAAKVLRVLRSADEVAHAPLVLAREEEARLASEVAFIGTWMPGRGAFVERLLQLGVPLSISGSGWQKAPEWSAIRKAWRGLGHFGPDYVKAVQCAKICLGLLSKGNRDLHTGRSAEIPYIGSVFCAERTEEHLAMYKEDEEAVFWDTPEQCAQECFALLADEERRRRIAEAGRRRCIRSGYLNEVVTKTILNTLLGHEESNAQDLAQGAKPLD